MILTIKLSDLELRFQVLNTELADLWIQVMSVRDQYPLDDPKRFYGFGSLEEQIQDALDRINHCITLIKTRYPNIVSDHLDSVHNQDQLNYWHHVFETYHGLLDKQDNTDPLTPVLADLNLAVHRCESIARGAKPRFVCTWYGLSKTRSLTDELIDKHGTYQTEFGTVYLNYAEIGKTLEDLTQDKDQYISDEAFKPFNHYSADFNVKFYDENSQDKLDKMEEYYNKHLDFFASRGYNRFNHPRLLPLRLPVAKLIETMPREQLLTEIASRQIITAITLQ